MARRVAATRAPTTFKTKTEARQFLATVQADMIRNAWCPPVEPQPSQAPDSRTITLATYAETWLTQQDLKDRTREHYRKLLDAHILPSKLARRRLVDITGDDVREWYGALNRSTPHTARALLRPAASHPEHRRHRLSPKDQREPLRHPRSKTTPTSAVSLR
jgi:hypothetical protein